MDTSTPSWLKHVRRRQELMDSVMQKGGVDVLTAVRADKGQAFFEARAKCRDCLHESDCRSWWLSEALPLPPNFCPNANFFRTCKREDHLLSPAQPNAVDDRCVIELIGKDEIARFDDCAEQSLVGGVSTREYQSGFRLMPGREP